MALLLGDAAAAGLQLPCPALLQEYSNHGATEHKVYVLGERVGAPSRPPLGSGSALRRAGGVRGWVLALLPGLLSICLVLAAK
jgi:hypothetical protein